MAEKDSTTNILEEQNEWEWLGDLLSRVFWPLDAFIRIIDTDDEVLGDIAGVIIPLRDYARESLNILDEVLAQSFGGPIKVKTVRTLETYGAYCRKDFGKAFIDPPQKNEQLQAVPSGGE